jgi:hypothetical protein
VAADDRRVLRASQGLRAKHEKPEGFQISRSKTMHAPVGDVFEAWGNARKRAQWLPASRLTIRKATENKSLRITWGDGTMIEVGLYPKGSTKNPDRRAARLARDRAGRCGTEGVLGGRSRSTRATPDGLNRTHVAIRGTS